MKTRKQKEEDLKEGREFLKKAHALVFVDFTKVPAEELRRLRQALKAVNAKLLILKKRLLAILLKEKNVDFDTRQHKLSLGAIFSEGDIEKVSAPIFKFFASLEVPEGGAKDMWVKHLIGGYDLVKNSAVEGEKIIFIGKLPPREVLLAQLLGMLAAPIRGFMHIIDQKSKQTSN